MRNLLIALLFAQPLPALAWQEPARGTPLRADLMNAVRPVFEHELGAPIEIVVHSLRVEGGQAFFSGYAQRPGGVPIDMTRTPMAARGDYYPDISDGTTMQALLVLSDSEWSIMHWAIGATDVWYMSDDFCAGWRAVLTDVCN
jgi:hypothetical protein